MLAQGRVAIPRISVASKELRADTITIFVVCFLVTFLSTSAAHGALAQVLQDVTPLDRGLEPLAIAKSLARSAGFANPFTNETGPTAHLGPIFPLYLAGVLLAAKSAVTRTILVRLGAALFHAAELALLPLLSAAALGEAEVGFLAALIGILIPCYDILPLWDSSLSGLAAIGFCIAALCVDPRSRLGMTGLGALWGAILLLNPALAIGTVAWAFFAARHRRWPWPEIGIALVSAALICLPWTIRNYRVLGGFVPIRDNFGLELQVSNNDYAAPAIRQNLESLKRFHPSMNARQLQTVREDGELRYNRDKLRQATAWIVQNPRRFAALSMHRVFEFWFPPANAGSFVPYGIWLITLLSVPGILLVIEQPTPYGRALLWMLALAPLPYYVVQSDPRYRTPFVWISLLLVGYAIRLLTRRRVRPVPDEVAAR